MPAVKPNHALAVLGSRLKAKGWTWTLQRPDLGWACARATPHTALRVRVATSGWPEGMGTLSIHLWRLELQEHARIDDERAQQILDAWATTIPLSVCVTYPADEPGPAQIDEVWGWFRANLRPWVREALAVAHQIEALHETPTSSSDWAPRSNKRTPA